MPIPFPKHLGLPKSEGEKDYFVFLEVFSIQVFLRSFRCPDLQASHWSCHCRSREKIQACSDSIAFPFSGRILPTYCVADSVVVALGSTYKSCRGERQRKLLQKISIS